MYERRPIAVHYAEREAWPTTAKCSCPACARSTTVLVYFTPVQFFSLEKPSRNFYSLEVAGVWTIKLK